MKTFLSSVWIPLLPFDRFFIATMSDELKVTKEKKLIAAQVLTLVKWNCLSLLKTLWLLLMEKSKNHFMRMSLEEGIDSFDFQLEST